MFLPALERLCSAKNNVQLTPHKAETWVAALGEFYGDRPEIANLAIVQLAVSDDPFPELGKLLLACELLRRQKDNQMPQDPSTLKFTSTKQLAKAWGIKV